MTALIFDLDGTLVDTAPDILAAINVVLASEGRRPIDLLTTRHMVGFGARSLIRQAFAATGEPVSEERLPALFDRFIAYNRANIAVESRPFPSVPETLAALNAKGTPMGVLTNKNQESADLLLPAVGLAGYFRVVFGGGTRPYSKPDPRIFHDTLAALSETKGIMIGDSVTDVATARAANVPVILVSYGYTPEPASTLGADAVTDDFAEIPSLAAKFSA